LKFNWRRYNLEHAADAFERMRNSRLVVTTYSYNALMGGRGLHSFTSQLNLSRV
jgi:hypothetical protein